MKIPRFFRSRLYTQMHAFLERTRRWTVVFRVEKRGDLQVTSTQLEYVKLRRRMLLLTGYLRQVLDLRSKIVPSTSSFICRNHELLKLTQTGIQSLPPFEKTLDKLCKLYSTKSQAYSIGMRIDMNRSETRSKKDPRRKCKSWQRFEEISTIFRSNKKEGRLSKQRAESEEGVGLWLISGSRQWYQVAR